MDRLLVVGATSAIAQATARYFAADGATFALVGRDPAKLEAVAADLQVRGGTIVHTAVCDLRELEGHEAVLQGCLAALGDVDAALVAHGTLPDQTAAEPSPRETVEALIVNCVSTISVVTILAGHFEQRRRGALAVVTSVAGDRGRRSNYLYGAAKAAVSTYLEGLRGRLRRSRVAVVDIKPGWVDTPMTAGRGKNPLYADPARVGKVIYRAMNRGQAVVYVPWFWRPVMWAIRAMPRAVMERLPV